MVKVEHWWIGQIYYYIQKGRFSEVERRYVTSSYFQETLMEILELRSISFSGNTDDFIVVIKDLSTRES